MRIVDLATFLALPEGTVYAKADTPDCYGFGSIEIRGERAGERDFYSQRLVGDFECDMSSDDWINSYDAMVAGETRTCDFNVEARDGLFNNDQLFAVFERADVEALIGRLQQTLA